MFIYWVRHGQTSGNKNRVLQTPSTPLCEFGLQQAEHLATTYKSESIGLVLCSDYLRAKQTVAPLLKQIQCSVEYSALLQERNFGDLRGLAYDQINADFFSHSYHPPNGESGEQFTQRICQAWEWVLQKAATTNNSILVMTHGQFLRQILTSKMGIKDAQLASIPVANTCVTQTKKSAPEQALLTCDISHLPAELRINTQQHGAV